MRRFLFLVAAMLAVFLVWANSAVAQTFPRDVTGTPSAECAALDATGTPQLCSPSNPLPVTVTGANPLAGGSGTGSAGQSWFLAQPPGFNPFIRPNGSSDGFPVYLFFLDDINLVGFGAGNAPNSTIAQYRSVDGGKSWVGVVQSAPLCGGFQLVGAVKVTAGYVFFCGGAITQAFQTTADGIQFTNRTATGAIPSNVRNPAVNGTTILVASPDPANVNDTICRSADSGVSWNCATMPAITGYTGANGFSIATSATAAGQAFAGPSASTWLVAGNDKVTSVGKILRSTNDGGNWTQVFTGGAPIGAVQCLSSTLCLAAENQRIIRSTDGGVTWTAVVTSGPAGATTNWNAVIPFSSTVAVVAPFVGGNSGSVTRVHFYRTVDAGLTWTDIIATPCARDNGATQGIASVAVRNGRAVVESGYGSLSTGGPCAHYSALGTGGTAVTGPLGVPWAITAEGFGPVAQGNPQIPFSTSPIQGINLFNSQTTGAANSAVTVTIAGVADQRAHIDRVEANCAPTGTSSLTIVETPFGQAGVTIWSTLSNEVSFRARFREQFAGRALTLGTQSAVTITLAACGAGNTGTLIVHADRF